MTVRFGYSAALLGLHGLENEFKLAHLPFLVEKDVFGVVAFQGSSGTGKTTMVKRIGELNLRAGGGPHGTYSADKIQYEDFIGFPMPNLEEKIYEVYPSKNSLATKEVVLIDELNRATYENQEKFLSLFASREIDSVPVKCRFIYVAMNPVMGKEGDKYDGTQPLDKALGERITFLINMPSFSQLKLEDKIRVITASDKQSDWEPSEDLVNLHVKFISEAREKYEEAKELHLERVAQYVCEVSNQLDAARSGIQLESRRAQFIAANILGIYALDAVYHGASDLKESARTGLIGSFPNTLWYEEVNIPALGQAHLEAMHFLDLNDSVRLRSFKNDSKVSRALKEIKEAAEQGENIENMTKLTTIHWPKEDEDPAGYAIWAFGAVAGLKGRRPNQTVIKENEFQRFEDTCKSFRSMDLYRYYLYVQAEFIKTGKFPDNYSRPDFIERAASLEAGKEFDKSIQAHSEAALFALCLMKKYTDLEANSYEDFVQIFTRISDTVKAFTEIHQVYTKVNSNV